MVPSLMFTLDKGILCISINEVPIMQLFSSITPVQSYDPVASLEALQEITDICNSITLSTPAFEALMELPSLAQEFNTTSTASLSM